MYFHGARFSNYEAWLSDPTHIKPSAQVVWPVVGQEILNGDVGGGFQGIQITSGFFQLWRASGITSELQLYTTAIGGLVMAAAMFFAGWFHYHKAAPKLDWFRNVESMLNHHLAGLLGLGSLSWAGHQIHVSLPVNKLLDAGVDPKEIPLPHDLLVNRQIMADLYPSFAKGLAPFFTLQWGEYSDFLTFNGGLNPVTGGLWLSDTAHHHVAIAVLFLVAGHMYRTNWGIGHNMKEILEAHRGPFTGEGHVGLYEILTSSWHAQLAINLAMFGSLSIIVAYKMMGNIKFHYLLEQLWVLCFHCRFLLKSAGECFLKALLSKHLYFPFFIWILFWSHWVTDTLVSSPWKNLQKKVNQQESCFATSSETIRENFSNLVLFFKKIKSSYSFLDYFLIKPQHKKIKCTKFLEWFIGFSEGDGSFTYKSGRPIFIINQADLILLKKIRTELGFGRVCTFTQNGKVYARLFIENQGNVHRLIAIFNGNIQLKKVHIRFDSWVKVYNKIYKQNIQVKPRRHISQLTLASSWISGFFDAEGGFSAYLSKNSGMLLNSRLYLNCYVDQKNEYAIMKKIANLFEVPNVTRRNNKEKYFRIEIKSKKCLKNVLIYFSNHSLKSRKKLTYTIWQHLVQTWLSTGTTNLKLTKLKRRVVYIQQMNAKFKKVKSVLLLCKDQEVQ
jgi:hypothetical protein